MRLLKSLSVLATVCLSLSQANADVPTLLQMETTKNAPLAATGRQPAVADTVSATDAVISDDGTKIGYRVYGRGPGLIIVQGAMGTAYNYDQLAKALAADFTVYVPDRRGRGMSPKEYSSDHAIEREVEDISSLVEKTGAHYLFGLSSGAIIALEATRVLPAIQKTIVYEPPFYLDGVPEKNIARLNQEIAQGELTSALVTIFKTTKVGPPVFNVLPRPILKPLTSAFLKSEAKKSPGEYAPIPALIPSTRYDFQVVRNRGGEIQSFKAVSKQVLLLGGSKSPAYLKNALATLEKTLPNVRRVELNGLDHSGPWNPDMGGSPALIAAQMSKFLQEK